MKKNYLVFFLVKLGFSKLTPLKKVKKAKSVIGKMTGNSNFGTPEPPLADVDKAADDVQDAEDSLDGTKIKFEERDNKVIVLNNKMKQLQSYVDTTANGDKTIILSSGMDYRNPPSKSVVAGPVEGLTIQPTLNEGEAFLKWKPLAKSGIKKISVSYDLITWQLKGETSKSKILLKGLTSGTMVHVRVACVNTAGSGDWSDIASCKVL